MRAYRLGMSGEGVFVVCMAAVMVGSVKRELCGGAMRSYHVANCGRRSRGALTVVASQPFGLSASPTITAHIYTPCQVTSIINLDNICAAYLFHRLDSYNLHLFYRAVLKRTIITSIYSHLRWRRWDTIQYLLFLLLAEWLI